MQVLSDTMPLGIAAKYSSLELSTLQSLIFDYHLIRLCAYSQQQPEFLEARTLHCRRLSNGEDISSLYANISDREERLERRAELDLLVLMDEAITKREEYDGVHWASPPPRLLYLNLRNALVETDDGTIVPVTGQRLSTDDRIHFDWFETAEQEIFSVYSEESDWPISIELRDIYVSKRELDRVIPMLKSKKSDSSASELEWIITCELALLLERRKFNFGDKTSINSIVDYVKTYVVEAPGLSTRNLSSQFKSALSRLGLE